MRRLLVPGLRITGRDNFPGAEEETSTSSFAVTVTSSETIITLILAASQSVSMPGGTTGVTF